MEEETEPPLSGPMSLLILAADACSTLDRGDAAPLLVYTEEMHTSPYIHVQVAEETQLLFSGHSAPIDCVAMLTHTAFVSGSQAAPVPSYSTPCTVCLTLSTLHSVDREAIYPMLYALYRVLRTARTKRLIST